MDRINTPNAVPDGNGPGKRGFRDGNKAEGIAPTEFNALHCNLSQEEICNVIESVGLVLDPDDDTQLMQALTIILSSSGLVKASSSEILAGTDDTKFATSAGLLAGLLGAGGTAANDYVTIPCRDKSTGVRRNFIIQWGYVAALASGSNVVVTLPITFTIAQRFATAQRTSNANSASANTWFAYAESNSQIRVFNGSGNPDAGFWISAGF